MLVLSVIETMPATILQKDGSIKEVRIIKYSLACGSYGHALTLKGAKPVFDIHVKNCKVCRKEYDFNDESTTDGSGNTNGRSLVYSR